MTTLNMNAIGYNQGLVHGNITARDREPGSQEMGQDPGLAESNQKYTIGRNKFSQVYVKDLANTILICV